MGGVFKPLIKVVSKGKLDVTGIAITAGLSLVQGILSKPGINANLKHFMGILLPGKMKDYDHHQEVARVADEIVSLFKSRQFSPNRIAVDGVPGSGKSTLTHELADRLAIEVECLDHRNMDEPLTLDKEHTIYEHHRLLRTQDIVASM